MFKLFPLRMFKLPLFKWILYTFPTSHQNIMTWKRFLARPPHHSSDCSIYLLPNSSTMPQRQNLPISSSRIRGHANIHLTFHFSCFCRSFCLCIDYRGLNKIAIKFRYPLLLVPAALEQLCTAKYFTKLGLCNTYNLIQICEGDKWTNCFLYHYRAL